MQLLARWARSSPLCGLPRLFSMISVDIPMSELHFSFSRSSGPGGQNVNKLNTKVEMRFNVNQSNSIDDEIKTKLREIVGGRLTKNGDIVIQCQSSRYQMENKKLCIEKLRDLISAASVIPKERIVTTELPTYEKDRWKEFKRRRSALKESRRYREEDFSDEE